MNKWYIYFFGTRYLILCFQVTLQISSDVGRSRPHPLPILSHFPLSIAVMTFPFLCVKISFQAVIPFPSHVLGNPRKKDRFFVSCLCNQIPSIQFDLIDLVWMLSSESLVLNQSLGLRSGHCSSHYRLRKKNGSVNGNLERFQKTNNGPMTSLVNITDIWCPT